MSDHNVAGRQGRDMSVQIELTGDQAATLRDALGGLVSDLGPEIAATDNAEYRRGLRERRDGLQAVLNALEDATGRPARPAG